MVSRLLILVKHPALRLQFSRPHFSTSSPLFAIHHFSTTNSILTQHHQSTTTTATTTPSTNMPSSLPKTHLLYLYDSTISTHQTTLLELLPYSHLPESDQHLFKPPPNPPTSSSTTTTTTTPNADSEANPNPHTDPNPGYFAAITTSTIFHPQGGGQPSDVGMITFPSPSPPTDPTPSPPLLYTVLSARMSTSTPGVVLHFGTFPPSSSAITPPSFPPSTPITQTINPTTRHLHSKYHTAGHILGSCVRSLLSSSTPNFAELKASHTPGSAACEFAGSIASSHLPDIQAAVDELVARGSEVRIEWWGRADFVREGREGEIPEGKGEDAEGRWRVVRIVGAEFYPCGGTHVSRTDGCVGTVVRKIARSKGVSRVSYSVKE